MKLAFSAWILIATIMFGSAGYAQQTAWVQIQAQPTLHAAEASVRVYSQNLEAVNGFRMRSGWYAIALGPFTRPDAESALINLKSSGSIPRDSFIALSNGYTRQFWPVGAAALTANPVTPQLGTGQGAVETPVAVPIIAADETRAEARASERLLDRPARESLQVALQWEGFYTSAIDGAFGPGTRRAMADYQTARNFEATGILTTAQRIELLASYQAVIDSLGMRMVTDHDAGIEIAMPSEMVKFARYEAPFAHYDPTAEDGARVVLISQSGDQNTLFGLYDILQTLEIVPLGGPRERKKSEFTLTGTDSSITSHTYAKLTDGAIKGFTLIWPADDEKRRQLALKEMKASFASLGPTALPDTAGLDDATQSIDLLSGLEIRRADVVRSGFYVDPAGTVLTSAGAVAACQRITIDDIYEAEVLASNADLGVAILQPAQSLAPSGIAAFLTGAPRLKSDIAVAGYSYEGRLGAPTLTFGTVSDLVGLNGETHLTRLALAPQSSDAGGPVLDSGGAVLGMLLAEPADGSRQLPANVSFAAQAGTLAGFLSENGVTPIAIDASASMNPVDLTTKATAMTVLVSCWN